MLSLKLKSSWDEINMLDYTICFIFPYILCVVFFPDLFYIIPLTNIWSLILRIVLHVLKCFWFEWINWTNWNIYHIYNMLYNICVCKQCTKGQYAPHISNDTEVVKITQIYIFRSFHSHLYPSTCLYIICKD